VKFEYTGEDTCQIYLWDWFSVHFTGYLRKEKKEKEIEKERKGED